MRALWVAAWVAGCSQDVCERDEVNDAACGRPHARDETKRCREALRPCTADDEAALEAYQDCYEASGAAGCSPTGDQYIDALDCLVELDGLTEGCELVRGESSTVLD
ncbi:MAG: hypothetical protein ABMA64_11985 [Myxococcota bacterium]